MDINPTISYLVSRSGQQFGPYQGSEFTQLIQAKEVLATDLLWTEGMDGWVPAGSFNQLAPVFASLEAPAPAPNPGSSLVESAPPIMNNPIAARTKNVETAVDAGGGVHVDRKGVDGPGIKQATIVTASDTPYRPGANYGLFLFSFILAIFACIAYLFLSSISVAEHATANGEPLPGTSGLASLVQNPAVMLGALGFVLVSILFCSILALKYLHRAWAYIQDLPNVTTTPGKAIGFLFIPLFNYVWLFFTYYKWAGDYNLRCDLSHIDFPPKANEGLFLTHCILCILGLPILFPFVMFQICKAINHLAVSPDLELVSSYS